MKNCVKILLLLVIQSGVLTSLPIKEDEHVKDEPHTKILDSVPTVSLEDQPKPCSDNLNHEGQGNMKHKGMLKSPAKMYVNNLQYANEYMVTIPQSAMDYLTAINRNMYQNTYVRSLPALDTLPSVYVTRPRIANYENREPYYYDPVLLKQKTVLVPIHLSPERSTSEEEFWAQISQDSIMKNIIPTMEVPLPREPYGQYEQLIKLPYPLSAQELMSNDGVMGYYPESELRAYEHPYLYRYKTKVSSERDISEDYPHTEIHTG
ncbi:hypothetical protein RR48_14653 [Papilio machaon]|uniref:Uncharacterized protein n=1 Tax=Papilio machaon TaxID=76193 RepID=A0A194QRP5_PAPMA|nr:hypothetical protein RR48_14653 [Papilio machaon]